LQVARVKDSSEPLLTKIDTAVIGTPSSYASLPTNGVYAYSMPDMDASYTDDMSLILETEAGYANWKNRNFLFRQHDEDGSMEIVLGRVVDSSGAAILRGTQKEFTLDNGVFSSSSFGGMIFGSEQQGAFMSSKMCSDIGCNGTKELELSPTFRNLSDSRASTSSQSGSETIKGFSSAVVRDASSTSLGIDKTIIDLVLGKDLGATPVEGSIALSNGGTLTLGSTEGKSAYIDNGAFASIALSGNNI